MKRYFIIYMSFLLLLFLGAAHVSVSGVNEQNAIGALQTAIDLPANQFDIEYENCKLNEASKGHDHSDAFLFDLEEDDERTNRIPSTAPSCLIKIFESKGRQLPEKVESYPISSSSRFLYSTERYISFCSIRV